MQRWCVRYWVLLPCTQLFAMIRLTAFIGKQTLSPRSNASVGDPPDMSKVHSEISPELEPAHGRMRFS